MWSFCSQNWGVNRGLETDKKGGLNFIVYSFLNVQRSPDLRPSREVRPKPIVFSNIMLLKKIVTQHQQRKANEEKSITGKGIKQINNHKEKKVDQLPFQLSRYICT